MSTPEPLQVRRERAAGVATGQGGTSLGPWWPRRSKYGATKTVVDGWTFHSKAESRRYQELLLLGLAGEIRNLELQPSFTLTAGVRYVADFRYDERAWRVGVLWSSRPEWRDVVEDVKGMKTPVYVLKRKLFMAQYPSIIFRETR